MIKIVTQNCFKNVACPFLKKVLGYIPYRFDEPKCEKVIKIGNDMSALNQSFALIHQPYFSYL